MLSNAYFLAKFRFDTAENEPAKNLQIFEKCIFEKCIFRKMHFRKARAAHLHGGDAPAAEGGRLRLARVVPEAPPRLRPLVRIFTFAPRDLETNILDHFQH